MEPLSLIEVVEATGGTPLPDDSGPCLIKGISTDSRTLSEGDLFVPIRGENFDGHTFIPQAVEKGAAAYFTEREPVPTNGCSVPAVKVESVLGAFMSLARYYRRKIPTLVLGITGSNGKTTTKDLLGRVLSEVGSTVYSERSYNNFVGLPLTIFRIDSETHYAVLEMGTNRPGEISALAQVAAPEMGIITNIGFCHLEGLKDRDGVVREKACLLDGLEGRRVAILNRDDPCYEALARSAPGPVVTFGICHRADYTAIHIDVNFDGVAFEVNGHKVRLPLLGIHSIYNALSVYACASELGVAPDRIAEVFAKFETPPMRLKPIRSGSLLVINDAYNANPGSMESAIKTFSVLPSEGRKIMVLGDMLELGDQSEDLHQKVGQELSCGDFDLVVAVGRRAQDYLKGAQQHGVPKDRLLSFKTTGDALKTVPAMLAPNDSILIKGSRKMGLEKLVEAVVATGI